MTIDGERCGIKRRDGVSQSVITAMELSVPLSITAADRPSIHPSIDDLMMTTDRGGAKTRPLLEGLAVIDRENGFEYRSSARS